MMGSYQKNGSLKITVLLVVLLVVAIILAAYFAVSYFTTKKQKTSYLFTQTAQSSTVDIKDGTAVVTLHNVSSSTVRFSDYPARVADTIDTKKFIEDWSNYFKKNHPNASFSYLNKDKSGGGTGVGMIVGQKYENGSVIYNVKRILPSQNVEIDWKGEPITTIPTETGAVSVFIDAGELPNIAFDWVIYLDNQSQYSVVIEIKNDESDFKEPITFENGERRTTLKPNESITIKASARSWGFVKNHAFNLVYTFSLPRRVAVFDSRLDDQGHDENDLGGFGQLHQGDNKTEESYNVQVGGCMFEKSKTYISAEEVLKILVELGIAPEDFPATIVKYLLERVLERGKNSFIEKVNFYVIGLSDYTFTPPQGVARWYSEIGNREVKESPAIGSDGTIYVGSRDGKLYAVDRRDGTKKWEFATGDSIDVRPAIGKDGTIYIGSHDKKLYAVNPDGTKKWDFATGGRIYSSPAIGSDGTIYIASQDGKLYAVNPNGTEKWTFKFGFRVAVTSLPAIGKDGTIYVGAMDKKLYALNPNGTKKWDFTTGDYIDTSPAIGSDGTIYIASSDGILHALNPNGVEKWEFKGKHPKFSSPAIGSDGTVYIGSTDYNLYALNPDGTEKWEFSAKSWVSSPMIDSDGVIYVGTYDGKLYAVNPDGTFKWVFDTRDHIYSSSPMIGLDGAIYIPSGSDSSRLCAVGAPAALGHTPWPASGHDLQNTGRQQ